jgi:general secretion pathway protein K
MIAADPIHRRSSGSSGRCPRQRGIALVMVLWMVVLLTIVAASFATHSRVETRMAGNLVEQQKVSMMVKTGLSRALLELMAGNSDQRWGANGEVHELQLAGGKVRIAIRNAAGLVDLNQASRDVLNNLFALIDEKPEVREQLVDTLNDWRDGDHQRRLNGAEDDDYQRAGLDFGTADRDLESVDELSYVMGFNRDAVERLVPYVTVYSGQSQVDNNYAAQDLIDILQGDRVLANGQVAEAFDQLDSDLADINDTNTDLDGLGVTLSDSYRISIEATTEGGGRSSVLVDVKKSHLRGKPFKIFAWHTLY